MKRLFKNPAWLLWLIIFPMTSVVSQDMPEAQKNLQRFAGNWICNDLQMTIGDKTYTGSFYFNGKSILDGTGIYGEEGFDHAELGSMRGFDLMNYDPNQQVIHWYVIDNMGTCHDHLCHWTDRDHFYAQYQGMVDGKIYVEKIYMHFLGDNKVEFKSTGEYNGVVGQKMTGVFTKK